MRTSLVLGRVSCVHTYVVFCLLTVIKGELNPLIVLLQLNIIITLIIFVELPLSAIKGKRTVTILSYISQPN